SWATRATATPSTARQGSTVALAAEVTSPTSVEGAVYVAVVNPARRTIYQQIFAGQTLAAGQRATYQMSVQIATTAATGTYVVRVGVFSSDGRSLYHWNSNAGSFSVVARTANGEPLLPEDEAGLDLSSADGSRTPATAVLRVTR
ncbi:MAG: hypothetical protein HYU88_03815, partial [Chloroflexi bacterium]|nr:hypothetical protein [Chloroflexota bacterium]